MRFRTTIELGGKTATGLQVPDDIVANLGSGKRPAVRIAVGGHAYRTTLATMDGRFMVPLNAEHRAAARVAAGDQVEVDIQLDTAPREVLVPPDLGEELASDSAAQDFFKTLSFTHRKEWVRWVEEAKKPETRRIRIAKTTAALSAGRRTR